MLVLNPSETSPKPPRKPRLLALLVSMVVLIVLGVGVKLLAFPHTGVSIPSSRNKSLLAPHEVTAKTAAPARLRAAGKTAPKTAGKTASKTPPTVTFTLAATGDYLTHLPVTRAARLPDGKYSLSKTLQRIKPWIEGADLALCHQEVPFGKPGDPPHGYPIFSMPSEMAADMNNMGYDGCSTASNHTWDQGAEGVTRTLDTLQTAGLGTAGTRRSAAETPWQMYELTKNGRTLKIAHLSLAYGLNHGNVEYLAKNPWVVELANPQRIIDDAKAARAAGADLVFVSAQAGNEYQYDPNPQQLEWTKMFAQSGVIDLYIGHHVHVPQPIEKLPGGPDGQGMWVYYGLGNVVSSQTPSMSIGTQIEQLAWVTVTVPGGRAGAGAAGAGAKSDGAAVRAGKSSGVHEEPVRIDARYVSLVLDSGVYQPFPIQPFLAGQNPEGSTISIDTVKKYYQTFQKIVGTQAKELMPAEGIPAYGKPATVKALPRV